MAKFVVYLRVSRQTQHQSGLGLEAQAHAVQQFLKTKQDPEVIQEFTEVEGGRRNKLHKRVKLQEALRLCEQEKATLVIAVWDRLARNVHFVSGLLESKVDFIACDNPHANKLTIHILAAVAEEEGDKISERTTKALAAAKRRGVVLGAPPDDLLRAQAQGHQNVRREAQEAYSHIYSNVVAMAASGMSQRDIADKLNQDGLRTRTGKEFRQITVRRDY